MDVAPLHDMCRIENMWCSDLPEAAGGTALCIVFPGDVVASFLHVP
ncbi:hypothetical protein SKA53_06337 [Yoonia vestfoldensis SKA53]|jgi:hypothetical protein|uniref:Uncharacterized protein n=1 Tax=Yoonia vestfoldensis SKA53 TaxID=314232 RepID=A3V7Q0_9RHOB|nr:hypothetical protein SKA53_06337 [Yoonia vestfoldensis SKA53]